MWPKLSEQEGDSVGEGGSRVFNILLTVGTQGGTGDQREC
jgi:hypothetical protein